MTTWLLAAVWAAVPVANAAECRASYDALRYREAALSCQAAIATAPGAALPELYRLLGLSLAALDEKAGAQDAFVSLLVLEPSATLSEAYSPRIREVFEAARRLVDATPIALDVRAPESVRVGVPVALEVTVVDGEAAPVQRLLAESPAGSAAAARVPGEQRTTLQLDAPLVSGPWNIRVAAVDRFGGSLAQKALTLEVSPVRAPRPFLLTWKPWLGAAAVVGAAGAASGWHGQALGNSARGAPFADDAYGLAERGRTWTTGANVAFGVAGALAVGTLILFITDPGGAP